MMMLPFWSPQAESSTGLEEPVQNPVPILVEGARTITNCQSVTRAA